MHFTRSRTSLDKMPRTGTTKMSGLCNVNTNKPLPPFKSLSTEFYITHKAQCSFKRSSNVSLPLACAALLTTALEDFCGENFTAEQDLALW